MTAAERKADIFVYVEDPGAANFAAELPEILESRGWTVRLASGGTATGYLQQRGAKVEALETSCDPHLLLETVNPRLIAVGTAEDPDSLGLRLISAAKSRNIASVGLVDSSANLDFRFRGHSHDPMAFCPTTLIVADTVCRDGLVKLGVADSRIIVAGHPHWDLVRGTYRAMQQNDRAELRERLFNLSSRGRKVVLFAAEISGGINAAQFERSDDYTLLGRGVSHGRTEIVIEELLDALKPRRNQLNLVLRLHPKHRLADLSAYAAEFDYVSQVEPSLEVVFAADVVVGMTSMLMTEAALMERPTLAILPRAREVAWLPTITAGITPYASSRAALQEKVAILLGHPRPPNAAVLDSLFPPGALERVAASINRLLAD